MSVELIQRIAELENELSDEEQSRMAAQAYLKQAEDRIEKLEAALRKIASGDGVYGQQAAEYKQIAKEALGDS